MQLFTNIQDELIERVNQSTDSLKIAVTWFTNHDLFDAVIKKLDNSEYKVTLIVLNEQASIIREELRAVFPPERLPALSLLGVAALADKQFLIEIDAEVIAGTTT